MFAWARQKLAFSRYEAAQPDEELDAFVGEQPISNDTQSDDLLLTPSTQYKGRTKLAIHTIWLGSWIASVLLIVQLVDLSSTLGLQRLAESSGAENMIQKTIYHFRLTLGTILFNAILDLMTSKRCILAWVIVGLFSLPSQAAVRNSTNTAKSQLRSKISSFFAPVSRYSFIAETWAVSHYSAVVFLAHTTTFFLAGYLIISCAVRVNVGGEVDWDLVMLVLSKAKYIWNDGVATTISNPFLKIGSVVFFFFSIHSFPFFWASFFSRGRVSGPGRRLFAHRRNLFFISILALTLFTLGIQSQLCVEMEKMDKYVTNVGNKAGDREYCSCPLIGCGRWTSDPPPSPTPLPSASAPLPPLVMMFFWEDAGLQALLENPTMSPFMHSILAQNTQPPNGPPSVSTNATSDHVVLTFESAFPTMGNTKKELQELLCGYDASVTSDWRDFERVDPMDCLPKIFETYRDYTTAVFSASALGSIEAHRSGFLTSFQEVYDATYFVDNGLGKKITGNCIGEWDMLEPLHKYITEHWAAQSKPMFIMVKTCSSHAHYQHPHKPSQSGKSLYQEYLESIEYTDIFFERLLNGLATQNREMYRKSSLLFVSDHGEGFGRLGHWSHGSCMFAECTQVPVIILMSKEHTAPIVTAYQQHQQQQAPLLEATDKFQRLKNSKLRLDERDAQEGCLSKQYYRRHNNNNNTTSLQSQAQSHSLQFPQCVLQGKGFRRLVDVFVTLCDLAYIPREVTPHRSGQSLLSSCGHDHIFVHSFFNPHSFAVHFQTQKDESWIEAVYDNHLTGFHAYNMTESIRETLDRPEKFELNSWKKKWLAVGALRTICCD